MTTTTYSPRGRAIAVVTGDGGSIAERGRAIVALGGRMTGAANTMANLIGAAEVMESKAVDKLAEACSEVRVELADAGKLYSGVGPYIRDYGTDLASVQATMRPIVEECRRLWNAYIAAENNVPPVGFGYALPDLQQTPEEREEERLAAQLARDRALSAWQEEARGFDNAYDTWWDAFEEAASGIEMATAKGIKDSFWDDLEGIFDVVLDILAIAGVILAILALVVGGPIVALLAAIVAVATLALTIYQFARGRAEWWELAFAIVGVIPFGQLAKFANGPKGVFQAFAGWAGFGDDMLSFGADAARWGSGISALFKPGQSFLGVMRSAPSAGYVTNFVEFATGHGDEVMEGLTGMGEQIWHAVDVWGTFHNNLYKLPYDVYDAGTIVYDWATGG